MDKRTKKIIYILDLVKSKDWKVANVFFSMPWLDEDHSKFIFFARSDADKGFKSWIHRKYELFLVKTGNDLTTNNWNGSKLLKALLHLGLSNNVPVPVEH